MQCVSGGIFCTLGALSLSEITLIYPKIPISDDEQL
jgi:hypothetical protein